MLVSEKILREWIETELSADELAETLTMGGIEVEEVISEDKWLKNVLVGFWGWQTDVAAHLEFMIVGGLIVGFLILEPHGLAQLWKLGKEKLRAWPFPY